MVINSGFKPGSLEVYCGPMKSGKSRALIGRFDRVKYIHSLDSVLFKPDLDTREEGVCSRFVDGLSCVKIHYDSPEKILGEIDKEKVVGIDEAQFFSGGIVRVAETLMKQGYNLLVAGLDLNFRGEPFGEMHNLLAIATHVYKLSSVCEYPLCGKDATRTQRLIGGDPAPYDSPEILIGDREEGYEARCLEHHFVPGK